MSQDKTRRQWLGLLGLAATGTLAGCAADDDDENGSDGNGDDGNGDDGTDGNGDDGNGDDGNGDDGNGDDGNGDDGNGDDGNGDDGTDGNGDDGNGDDEVTQPDTQSFSGTGQAVEDGIDIEGGLTVIEATHDGNSNFQVSLVDDSEFDDNFVNVIGDFDGAQADYIDAGEYILDVNADGDWTIDVVQPRAGSGDALPQSLAGEGPDVIGPIEFDGTGVATGSHDGESNFQVQIFELGARFPEIAFNEIGDFDGETTFSADGVAWVDVNADGSWSVDFE